MNTRRSFRFFSLFGCFFSMHILFIVLPVQAQNNVKHMNYWFFGNNAGISFAGGTPKAIANCPLDTDEGCSAFSDEQGNLLFFSDGITVYTREKQVMVGGNDLMGDPSSTQSCLIVPNPGKKDIYYIFTTPATANDPGLRYSVVDMTKSGGLGAVTSKNTYLTGPVSERIAGTPFKNGKGYWIVTHEWQSNRFFAYKVTEKGVDHSPVISECGPVHNGSTLNSQGCMKISPDGSKIAIAMEESSTFDIFKFNNETGQVSDAIILSKGNGDDFSYPYGVEFSPNSKLLYASASGDYTIYQFNLSTWDDTKIENSVQKIGSNDNGWIGTMQLGPDDKLYFTRYSSDYLGVISNPNAVGTSCGFTLKGVSLGDGVCHLGLPNFVPRLYPVKEVFTPDTVKPVETGIKMVLDSGETLIEPNKSYVLKNVHFETGKYQLEESSYPQLNDLVKLLKQNPQFNIVIAGHTDVMGSAGLNMKLSRDRAIVVSNYLIDKGINESRITWVGYGSSKPLVKTEKIEANELNRRVEFTLIDKKK